MAVNAISKLLTYADTGCDYVPFLSMGTNAGVLAGKVLFSLPIVSGLTAGNPFVEHVKNKSMSRCIGLIVCPFLGNGAVAIYDAVNSCVPVVEEEPEEAPVPPPLLPAFSRRPLGRPLIAMGAYVPSVATRYTQAYALLRQVEAMDLMALYFTPITDATEEKKNSTRFILKIINASAVVNRESSTDSFNSQKILAVIKALNIRIKLAKSIKLPPPLPSFVEADVEDVDD